MRKSICLGCKKEYIQNEELDLMDRIHCNDCNKKFEEDFLKRTDKNKMDIPAGKRIKPKRKPAYEKKLVRKKKEYKFEYTLNY